MSGMYKYSMEIESNVKKLLLDTKELQDRMDTLEGKEYKINLNIDEKKLGNVISNLEKMLDSLGKGTGDFKQFENLSKELSSIVSEVQSLSKAFGKVDDSGTKTLLSSIQNIDKSLSELSQNILNVNKNMSNMGGNTSGAVKQVENISDAYQNAAKEAEKLADAQSKIGQKTNISLGDSKEQSTEIDLYHNLEKRKVTYDEIIDKIQTIISLKEKEKSLSKTSDDTKLYQKLYDENDINWAGDTEGTINRISDRLKEIYIKYNGKISLINENDIQEAAYLLDILKGAGESPNLNKSQEKFYQNKKFSNDSLFDNIHVDSQKTGEIDKINTELSETYRWFNQLEGVSLNENIANEIKSLISDMQIGGKNANEYANDLLKIFNIEVGSNSVVEQQNKLQSELKETESQAEKTTMAVKEVSSTASTEQKKDAFPNADAKPETEGMKQVEEAIHNAVQAKKDFATANEGVQSSIDDSENPLKLEAELMGQIAKSAREAADAKKEFVEANKQVKNSADGSNSENKKKDKYAKRRKISEEDFLNFSPSRVNENLSNSGYTILGETVNTELVDGLVKVSAKIKDVDGVWKSFSAKVDADGNIFEQRFKTVTNGVDKLETALKNFGRETSPALTYQETLDKAQKIKNSLNLGDEYSIKVDSSEFVTITKKLTDVENTGASVTQTFKSAQDAIDNFGKSASNSAERTSVALKSVKSNIKEVTDESEKLANAQKEQNVNANLNKYDKQLDSYNGKVDKYQATIARFNNGGWTSDEYLDNVQAVKDAVKKYEDLLNNIRAKGGITSEEDIQNLKEYESEIKNTIATVTNMSAAEKGYNFVSGQKELDKIHKLLNENSKMSSEAKAKIKAYYTEIESGNPSMSLDRIHGEIMKIYNAEVEAGRAGRSFFDTLKNSGFHQLAAQMSGMFGFYDVINLIKQAASAVTELNTQITELAKVSEDSVSQIYADFDSYANIAKEMGSTISDTIAATTAWSKNGYNIPDSKELAEVSLLYKNVGDGINIDEANESLVSTLKGFKLEADQAEHIVDVFNEVSNREPISSSGIGEALQRSAASFNAANTSLEKSVALVTATNSVLQDPEKVGNMWKTVSARIRGAKTELEEAGEDTDGMVESTSKLQALIKGMTGFDIMESDGKTFKDIYDIIIGIGKKWQDLNDVDRASLLEKLAGKNQSNALAAALSQVDLLKKAYGEATNAEGSAREENSKYQQSVQYSIDQTKAKLEELANDTLNSKFLKGLINAGGKIIDILDIIIKNVGILKPLIAGLAIKNIVKNFD